MELFQERQTLHRNPIMWITILLILATGFWAVKTENALPGDEDWPGMLILMAVQAGLVLLLLQGRLETFVTREEIRFRWFPFMWKARCIRWSDVASAEVRSYKPIQEYGGWGLKGYSHKNRAFTIDGNVGLQLVMKSGARILIGTKQREKLEVVLFEMKIPKTPHV